MRPNKPNRKRILVFVWLVCILPTLCASEYPNIIFILADDLGLGDVKVYGGENGKVETPNIDRLALEGMRFSDAHSPSSVCTPTRYSILTGRYNWRSSLKKGVLNGYSSRLIENGRSTVASMLKEHGYDTACIGKWHLGMDLPTTDGRPPYSKAVTDEDIPTQCNIDWEGEIRNGPTSIGFDYFWGIAASLDMPPYLWIEGDRFVGKATVIKPSAVDFPRPGPAHADFRLEEVLPTLTRKACTYIEGRKGSGNPFFLYMALNSPHTPIAPSKGFIGKSGQGLYGDFVMETDWAIGEVVKAVESSGQAGNTLIIVTADNGCSPAAAIPEFSRNTRFLMGEEKPTDADAHYPSANFRGHKADIYEGGHRVPLIVRWDGKVKPGIHSKDPVCLVDLYATSAQIVGHEIPDDAAEDSVSLLPILLGQPGHAGRDTVIHHSINGSFAIRQGDWKLIFCPGSGGWSIPQPAVNELQQSAGLIQLYNLAEDPAETNNLADDYPEQVEKLTRMIQCQIDKGRSTSGNKQANTGETHLFPDWIRKKEVK